MFKRVITLTVAAMMILGLTGGAALADEISDQIKRGMKLYEDGNLSGAVEELEFALAQMRQKKAESLTTIFPKAPSGWKAEKPQAQSAGRAMLGGGINVTQTYVQDGGQGRVSMEVLTDSPFIQTLGMILANPMMMQGGDQGKLIRIHGEKGVIKEMQGNAAELQVLIDKKILFKVEAREVKQAGQVTRQFAEMMDVKKLRELTK